MIRIALLILALTFPFAAPAQVMSQDEVLSAEILPGWRTADGRHMAALSLTLAPDWKTYWRTPGVAGLPPVFDFTGSRNVGAVVMHWPRPEVLYIGDMISVGYDQRLVLPFEITLPDPTAPAEIRLQVDLGICRDICIPATLDLTAVLPLPGAPDAAITAALQDQPLTGAEAGVAAISCQIEPIADGLRLTARLTLPAQGGEEVVVVEPGDPSIWVSQPVTARQGGTLISTTDLVGISGAPFVLDRSAVTVTVLSRSQAVEIKGCPAP